MHSYSTQSRQQFVRICNCGCGQPTLIAWDNDEAHGRRRGQPCRFLRGHALQNHPNAIRLDGDIAYLALTARNGDVVAEALVDSEDVARVRALGRWYRTSGGYVHLTRRGTPLHRFIIAAPPGLVVDHINHNPLDCRKINLRACSISENLQNRAGARRDSTSGYRNVKWVAHRRCWRVTLSIHGRWHHVGYFADVGQAEQAAENARRQYYTHTLN